MNAAAPFLDVFAARPDAVAIVEASGRTTRYGELLRQTNATAHLLRVNRLAPGDRVLLQVPGGPLLAACTLATIALGGVPLLADPGLGDAVYSSRVAAAAPRFALVHPLVEAIGRVTPLRRRLEARSVVVPPAVRGVKTIRLARAWVRFASRSPLGRAPARVVDVAADHDGVLVFTGGTTSDPRGVRHVHGGLAAYLDAIGRVSADFGQDFGTFLADTPQQMLYALRLGKTVHLTPGKKPARAAFAHERFASGAVDAYFGSPWIWQQMMDAVGQGERLPPTLRAVFLGGAPVSRPFLERLSRFVHAETRIVVLYGLTEAGPVAAVEAADKLAWVGDGDLVGRPLAGVDVRIDAADERGVGEVLVRSPSLFAGYLGEPTRAPDAPLRTGDLGRLIDDGRLALVGRVKDMIIRRGVNLYPPSFEATIDGLSGPEGPWVRRSAMLGVWSEARADEDVVLAVEPAPGFDEAAFRAALEVALGSDATPDRLLVLDALPVTGRLNKVDKAALRRLAAGEGA